MAVILLALPLFAALPDHPVVMARLHDFGHAPLFGALALVAWQWLPPPDSWHRYLLAFTIAVACGAGVEVVQGLIGRDAAWQDLAMDAAGAGSALLFLAAWRLGAPEGRRLQARLVASSAATALLLLAAAPLLHAGAAHLLREHRFPVLLQADTALDAYYLSGGGNRIERRPLPDPWRRPTDKLVYRVELQPVAWSGFTHAEPSPDWRGYETLVLTLVNPDEEALDLTLRVHDQRHNRLFSDRFNRDLQLPAATRTDVRIPLIDIAAAPRGREMDLARIAGLMLFVAEAGDRPREFYLAGIRLD